MFIEYSDVLTVTDMAKMLNIGLVLAYKLVKDKSIKSKKVGREYKILKSDVVAFLQSNNREN